MNNQPFLNDTEFFKSLELDDNGKLKLLKSIPTVNGTLKKVQKEIEIKQTTIPKEVLKFKKEIEDAFIKINNVMKDLIESYDNPEKCAELLKYYKDFKNEFQYKLNDAINYPKSNNKIETVGENEYEKSRVNLNKK